MATKKQDFGPRDISESKIKIGTTVKEKSGANSLNCGFEPPSDDAENFYVPRSFMQNGHTHIQGRTRSGKTSTCLIPLFGQLVLPYTKENPKTKE